jgi:hypothetical protein
MAGAARSTINGINRDNIRHIVKAPRAAAEIMNGLTLLDSRILDPCQEAGKACPRQETKDMAKARVTLTALTPEYPEYCNCSSNIL